jgi:hypothetical protein
VRTKYRALPAEGGGIAAALDLRVPTGDETNLLGTGGVQARAYGIGSMTLGPFAPHVNLGYTFSSEGALPGTECAMKSMPLRGSNRDVPRATLRWTSSAALLDAGQLRETEKQFHIVGAPGAAVVAVAAVAAAADLAEVRTPDRRSSDDDAARTPAGARQPAALFRVDCVVQPRGAASDHGGTPVPLTDTGLRDRVTPVIGIDYEF